jgi:hypothetical protein
LVQTQANATARHASQQQQELDFMEEEKLPIKGTPTQADSEAAEAAKHEAVHHVHEHEHGEHAHACMLNMP